MKRDYICFSLQDKFLDLACVRFMNHVDFRGERNLIELRDMIVSKEYKISV